MKVTFWKGVFVADSLPGDLAALKKLGFEAHEPTTCDRSRCKACRANIGRRWWTARVEVASRARPHCTEVALKVMQEHLEMLARSRAVESDIVVPSPPGMEYRPYQRAGIAYALQRKDTLIADEPGLGKTIQALGFVNYVKARTVLVVAPATLSYNWVAEAQRWLVGDWTIFSPSSGSDPVPEVAGNLLVVTTYEKLVEGKRGLGKFAESVRRVWDVGVFDEAHYLKNTQSGRSAAVLGVDGLMQRCRRCLFLSGTPVENFPREIWPVAAAACPAKFGSWIAFANRYCGRHREKHGDRTVWVADGGTHLAELQQRLRATFMVRRLKRDVLKELPPKRRQLVVLGDQEVDWSRHPEFRRWKEVYERSYDDALAKVEAAKTEVEYRTAVKQLDAVVGVSFEEISDLRHKTALLKLPMCLRYLDDLLASTTDNIIVFAHHLDVIAKVAEHYEGRCVVLTGSTPQKQRGAVIEQFQRGEKRIFVGQLATAGVGITLTRASIVVFVEIDWVPGKMTQAEDRACRIGQKKMVHVIHLALNNTLDVNMSKKVIAKQDAIDKTLDRDPDGVKRSAEMGVARTVSPFGRAPDPPRGQMTLAKVS